MDHPFVDMFGVKLEEGDKVAVAFPGPSSNSPVIRIGTVQSFGRRKSTSRYDFRTKEYTEIPGDPTVEFAWDIKHSSYGIASSKLTDTNNKRYMKIN